MSTKLRPRKNLQIRVPQVLVIDETGQKLGVLNTQEAIKLAQGKGLDLVEISPRENPPITRIMNFGKWMYDKEKAERKKGKAAKSEVKIMRIGLMTGGHDLEVKAKKIDGFLKKGDKVQIELRLKGRQMTMKNMGRDKIKSFLEFIKEPAEPEGEIKSQGRSLNLVIRRK